MTTVMLWFDDSKDTLSVKIQRAAAYYQKKYGHAAELCLVHPSALKDQKIDELTGITVRPYRSVLPGHLWIGVEDMPTEKEESVPA